jgi:hypothetical protein
MLFSYNYRICKAGKITFKPFSTKTPIFLKTFITYFTDGTLFLKREIFSDHWVPLCCTWGAHVDALGTDDMEPQVELVLTRNRFNSLRQLLKSCWRCGYCFLDTKAGK